MLKKILMLATALLLWDSARPLPAQVANEGLADKIIAAHKANAALLKQYSWSSRTELLDTGTVKDTRIDLVSFGPDGQLQRTIVNDQSAPLPNGFLRRRVAENERDRVERYMTGLGALFDQYASPSAGKIIDFMSTAQISAPDGNGILQLTGGGLIQPADSITLSIDAKTRQATRIVINTMYNGDTVQVTATFVKLPSGLTHLQYTEVTVPDKNMSLQVHNFDYNSNN